MLSRLKMIKKYVLLIWEWTTLQFERVKRVRNESRRAVFVAAGTAIVLLLLILSVHRRSRGCRSLDRPDATLHSN